MNAKQLLIAAVFGGCACSAFAQWQWVDESGRKVFSDRPPPTHISPAQILKHPRGTPAPIVDQPVSAAAPALAAPALAPPAGLDPELEKKKQALEAQEAAKRKAELDQFAKDRAENCRRAQATQRSLESGVMIGQVNAKGEREFMSPESRQQELRRTQQITQRDCSPLKPADQAKPAASQPTQ